MWATAPPSAREYRVRHLHLGVDVAQHVVQPHNVVNDIIKLEERKVHLGVAHLKGGSRSPSTTPPHPTCSSGGGNGLEKAPTDEPKASLGLSPGAPCQGVPDTIIQGQKSASFPVSVPYPQQNL